MPKAKTPSLTKAYTKSQLINTIAEETEVSRKDVAVVFDSLAEIIARHLKKRSVGAFTLPGLLKITTQQKPAQKARRGVPNPFRPGETMDIASKPASSIVKIRPLKMLKDMVS